MGITTTADIRMTWPRRAEVETSHNRARHILPQSIALFLVIESANIGVAITTEAALSLLGNGVPPPTPTWGNMLGGVLAESL